MANVFDYLKWRGDLSFAQSPLNGVDALIFSGLSYVPFVGRVQNSPEVPITLRDAAEAEAFAWYDWTQPGGALRAQQALGVQSVPVRLEQTPVEPVPVQPEQAPRA